METSFKPVARKENLVVQESSDEVLVYDLTSNKAHCLNSTAAFIWRSCDGANSVEEIGSKLSEVSGNQIPADLVWLAVDQLQEKNLLAAGIRLSDKGSSRRDMLKRLGLVAVVALPVVASLVAPKSALASTSCACVTAEDCLSQAGCPTGACPPSSGICSSAQPT